jgi:hypothetical protein
MKEITVKGESIDGTYKFNDTKKFTLKTENFFVSIETDKPAYKPGDKGLINITYYFEFLNLYRNSF